MIYEKNVRNGKLRENYEFTFISLYRLIASRDILEPDLGNGKLQDLQSNSGFKYGKVYEHVDRNIAKVAGNKLPETYIPLLTDPPYVSGLNFIISLSALS
jgi:hypothetical protein